MSDERLGDLDGWRLWCGVEGWKNPPPGCAKPRRRFYAQCDDSTEVTAWVEGGFLQVKDDMVYYPGGCYSVPLSVIRWLDSHV